VKPIPIRTGAAETKWFVRLLVLLSILALFQAVDAGVHPASPPFQGRWRWFSEALFQIAGPAGLVAPWLVLAFGLALAARMVWRRTPKVPSDRWLR